MCCSNKDLPVVEEKEEPETEDRPGCLLQVFIAIIYHGDDDINDDRLDVDDAGATDDSNDDELT